MIGLNVDDLAQEIRRVDGKHSLGAAALAEALMPFLLSREAEQEARTGSMRHDVDDGGIVMVACGQCQGIGCDFCDGFGHFNKRAPNLEERDRIEAAITADYENDLRDMTDDEIASEIVSAQNAIDEHEPWLEALVTRQTQRARQKEADHG